MLSHTGSVLTIFHSRSRDRTFQDCRRCGGVLPEGQLGVIAPKFGEQVAWHCACFTCDTCHELLVDLTYCVKDGKIFCERHYAEQIKPRCAACDEVSDLGRIISRRDVDERGDSLLER